VDVYARRFFAIHSRATRTLSSVPALSWQMVTENPPRAVRTSWVVVVHVLPMSGNSIANNSLSPNCATQRLLKHSVQESGWKKRFQHRMAQRLASNP
jgi:hypothetical protein